MHQDIPKQFITVNEKPVIVYTLEAFQKHVEIDAIAVVCISVVLGLLISVLDTIIQYGVNFLTM